MKQFFTGIFLIAMLQVFAQDALTIAGAPAVPGLFGVGLISTGFSERDFALSPDGNEIFYTLQSPQGVFQTILHLKKDERGQWSKPTVASFAGRYSDLEPAFSTDGRKLFFSSNRPLSGDQIKDFDIWVTEKINGAWSEPRNLGSPVNSGSDEFYPSLVANGNLYFTAAYQNGIGKEDIFLSKWEHGRYNDPEPLDTAVNSGTYEFNAFVSPDESYIIFSSFGRKDDTGRGDLYISVKDAFGRWKPARNLAALNSTRLDYCPFVSFDQKILFFTSERHSLKSSFPEAATVGDLQRSFSSVQNGGGDIYWVDFHKLIQRFK